MIIWIFTILSFLQAASQEKLIYDIYYGDEDVGDYELVKTRKKGVVEYQSRSLTKVQFLASVEVEVTQKVRYENGLLTWSEASTRVNGNQRKRVVVRRVGNRYEVNSDGENYGIGDEIHFSVVKLIFQEPSDLGRVFSEIEGEFQRIEKKGSGEYVKTDSRGRKNFYTYDKQAMKRAAVDAGLYEFKMRRRD